jgi:hypothetical protein
VLNGKTKIMFGTVLILSLILPLALLTTPILANGEQNQERQRLQDGDCEMLQTQNQNCNGDSLQTQNQEQTQEQNNECNGNCNGPQNRERHRRCNTST